jgi:hypothetical protein
MGISSLHVGPTFKIWINPVRFSSQVYFIAFWMITVMVVLNLVVAFVLEAFFEKTVAPPPWDPPHPSFRC